VDYFEAFIGSGVFRLVVIDERGFVVVRSLCKCVMFCGWFLIHGKATFLRRANVWAAPHRGISSPGHHSPCLIWRHESWLFPETYLFPGLAISSFKFHCVTCISSSYDCSSSVFLKWKPWRYTRYSTQGTARLPALSHIHANSLHCYILLVRVDRRPSDDALGIAPPPAWITLHTQHCLTHAVCFYADGACTFALNSDSIAALTEYREKKI